MKPIDLNKGIQEVYGQLAAEGRVHLFYGKRERVNDLLEWCYDQVLLDNPPVQGATGPILIQKQPYTEAARYLKLAKADKQLKKQCGSIFIMLLGNLVIQLFILWLKRRLDNK